MNMHHGMGAKGGRLGVIGVADWVHINNLLTERPDLLTPAKLARHAD